LMARLAAALMDADLFLAFGTAAEMAAVLFLVRSRTHRSVSCGYFSTRVGRNHGLASCLFYRMKPGQGNATGRVGRWRERATHHCPRQQPTPSPIIGNARRANGSFR